MGRHYQSGFPAARPKEPFFAKSSQREIWILLRDNSPVRDLQGKVCIPAGAGLCPSPAPVDLGPVFSRRTDPYRGPADHVRGDIKDGPIRMRKPGMLAGAVAGLGPPGMDFPPEPSCLVERPFQARAGEELQVLKVVGGQGVDLAGQQGVELSAAGLVAQRIPGNGANHRKPFRHRGGGRCDVGFAKLKIARPSR